MKKLLKILMSSVVAFVLSALTLTGCAQTPSVTIKAPNSDSTSQSVVDGSGESVGLKAGFELPHGSGFVDNDETQVHIYDSEYYYFNDPLVGKDVKYSRRLSDTAYEDLFMQAIAIYPG